MVSTMAQKTHLDETALRVLLDQAPDAIFIADNDGRYTYVNDAACRLVGYAPDEMIGCRMADMIPACDIERLGRARAAMLGGATGPGEWTLRRKDGAWVPVEVNAKILPDGQWQGFVRDISARKAQQAEREALMQRVETERRWRQAVMDTLPIGVVLFEPDGRISANRHMEELFGRKVSESAGSEQYGSHIFYPDGTLVPPEELASHRVISHGETVIGTEYLLERPDGTRIPVLGSAAPIIDGEGRVIGGVGVMLDASERMRLEQAVRANERMLKAVFDILPVGIWIADQSGRIVKHNPAAERIWRGARHVPLSGYGEYKGWWVDTGALIAPEEWALARALATGEVSSAELVRIECFDGSCKTIINSGAPLRDEKGEITGAIVVNEDITALHEIQEKQRASEHLFRTVFELLPVGLWITDREGRITLSNPAAARIWQGTRHDGQALAPEYKAWSADTGTPIAPEEWVISRAIRLGETSRSELIRIQCSDGSFKTVINWGAPIRSDAGEISGAVAVNEDVTALHQTQEQLRAAVRDREEILAVVTHDLRNPLSALKLVATAAEHKARALPGGEPVRSMAAQIIDITRSMSSLVSDLLAIAVSRPGRSMLKLAPVKAAALIAKAAEAARPLFAREGLGLEIEVIGELPVIQVDSERILRVFANLLDNAIKFTERPGAAVLRAEAISGSVRFCVGNTGPALSAEEMASMFQPFWQAAGADRRGAGLGLAICRSVVEAHGGSIWAEPCTGKRVRICVLLPCTHAEEPRGAATQ
jgi:PAS domain S-box-containing protein